MYILKHMCCTNTDFLICRDNALYIPLLALLYNRNPDTTDTYTFCVGAFLETQKVVCPLLNGYDHKPTT